MHRFQVAVLCDCAVKHHTGLCSALHADDRNSMHAANVRFDTSVDCRDRRRDEQDDPLQ